MVMIAEIGWIDIRIGCTIALKQASKIDAFSI